MLNANFKAKNYWKCIFRASRRVSFSYFPKVAINNWGCVSPIPFRIFVDYFTGFNSIPMGYSARNGAKFLRLGHDPFQNLIKMCQIVPIKYDNQKYI